MTRKYHRTFASSGMIQSHEFNRQFSNLDNLLSRVRDGAFEWDNRTTIPALPAAGYRRLYFRAGILYHVDSAGLESAIGIFPSYACIQDQKASGTGGGTTGGAVTTYTRDLNTIVSDDDDIITSLVANQITIEPGNYSFNAFAPGYKIAGHHLRLYSITDAATLFVGPNVIASTGANSEVSQAYVGGEFTVTVQTVLELQHDCSPSFPNANNFGYPASLGTEVYAQLEIWRQP